VRASALFPSQLRFEPVPR